MQEILLKMRQDAINKQVHAAQSFGFQNGRLVAIDEILATLNGKEQEPDGEAEA